VGAAKDVTPAPADPLARARALAERGRFRDAFDIANGEIGRASCRERV